MLSHTAQRTQTSPKALNRRRLPGRGPRMGFSLGLLLAACMTMSSTAAAHQPAPHEQPQGRLTVSAHHTLEVAPNMATLSARLWERTPARAVDSAREASPEALSEARSRLEARMGELIRTLEATGLPRSAIQAGSLSVQPSYVQGPVNADGQPDRRVRTQLTRPITMTLDDLEALPDLLDALTTASVDSLDGVSYDLKDRTAASDEALGLAIDRAKAKAALMAERLDIRLGRVLQVQETQMPSFQPQMMMRASDASAKEMTSEYRPGQIEIDAEVEVHWAIADE